MIFEGWDAAGKGGAIRRVASALDARDYQVIPVAAPTDEERAQHYLWRFWRHLSREGRMTIFDRSWYGRVLVERVEGFATAEGWGDKLYPWSSDVDCSGLPPGTYTFVAMTDDASGGEGGGPTQDTKTFTLN